MREWMVMIILLKLQTNLKMYITATRLFSANIYIYVFRRVRKVFKHLIRYINKLQYIGLTTK